MDLPPLQTLMERCRRLWRWIREDSAWPFFYISSSMLMFWGIVAVESIWVIWNLVAPPGLRFDTAPGFPLMLLLGNQWQLLYLPIINSTQKTLSHAEDQRQQRDAAILQAIMSVVDAVKTTLTQSLTVIQEVDREGDDRYQVLLAQLTQITQRLDCLEQQQAQTPADRSPPASREDHV